MRRLLLVTFGSFLVFITSESIYAGQSTSRWTRAKSACEHLFSGQVGSSADIRHEHLNSRNPSDRTKMRARTELKQQLNVYQLRGKILWLRSKTLIINDENMEDARTLEVTQFRLLPSRLKVTISILINPFKFDQPNNMLGTIENVDVRFHKWWSIFSGD